MIVPESPRDLGLPKDTWRPHQAEAVQAIVDSDKHVTVLIAPMGSGKSLIANAIPEVSQKPMVTLTKYKSLQNQYSDDFHISYQ